MYYISKQDSKQATLKRKFSPLKLKNISARELFYASNLEKKHPSLIKIDEDTVQINLPDKLSLTEIKASF